MLKREKTRIVLPVLLLLVVSAGLFAENTISIQTPVASEESEETQQMIYDAVKEGVIAAGYKAGDTRNMKLETWLRKQQGFYQVKMTLIAGDVMYSAQERYQADELTELQSGLTALVGQVFAEKAAEERRILELLDKRNMVKVEGVSFQMGSNDGDSDEKPVHRVTLSTFYISRYEVTQGLWKEVMGSNPSDSDRGIGNSYPVNEVSWYDAVRFCNKLSELDGLDPAYRISGTKVSCDWSKNGYRLPTEAEWEYAARGGNGSRGYTYSGSDSIGEVAWYIENSVAGTHKVGQKNANELGLYDMSGNVWEWCWDWYGDYNSRDQQDPRGTSSGSYRVFRGGSWYYFASDCRTANRYRNNPEYRYLNLGFRLARPAVQ